MFKNVPVALAILTCSSPPALAGDCAPVIAASLAIRRSRRRARRAHRVAGGTTGRVGVDLVDRICRAHGRQRDARDDGGQTQAAPRSARSSARFNGRRLGRRGREGRDERIVDLSRLNAPAEESRGVRQAGQRLAW